MTISKLYLYFAHFQKILHVCVMFVFFLWLLLGKLPELNGVICQPVLLPLFDQVVCHLL